MINATYTFKRGDTFEFSGVIDVKHQEKVEDEK